MLNIVSDSAPNISQQVINKSRALDSSPAINAANSTEPQLNLNATFPPAQATSLLLSAEITIRGARPISSRHTAAIHRVIFRLHGSRLDLCTERGLCRIL